MGSKTKGRKKKTGRRFGTAVLLAVLVMALLAGLIGKYLKRSGGGVAGGEPIMFFESRSLGTAGQGVSFGANINGPNINPGQISEANLAELTYWVYLPEYLNPITKNYLPGKLPLRIKAYSRQRGGLTVQRVHLMPQTREGAAKRGGFYLPENTEKYSQQVAAMAADLGPGVRYYSVSNETPELWGDSAANYGRLLEITSAAVKKANPQAVVLDSGLASSGLGLMTAYDIYRQGRTAEAIRFLNEYFAKSTPLAGQLRGVLPLAANDSEGLAQIMEHPLVQENLQFNRLLLTTFCPYFDELQIHFYAPWQSLPAVIGFLKKNMRDNNCVKPLQIWEIGYGLDADRPYDPGDHARSVPKYLAVSAMNSRFIDYSTFYERDMFMKGLYETAGGKRPAAAAFNTTTAKLAGSQPVTELKLGKGVWGYRFDNAGRRTEVVWAETERTVSLTGYSPGQSVVVTDIEGQTKSADPGRLAVGVSPVFVEAAKD